MQAYCTSPLVWRSLAAQVGRNAPAVASSSNQILRTFSSLQGSRSKSRLELPKKPSRTSSGHNLPRDRHVIHRFLSLKSVFKGNFLKGSASTQLQNAADEADDTPTSLESQISYYNLYLSLIRSNATEGDESVAVKLAQPVVERFEVQTKLFGDPATATNAAIQHDLLKDPIAWSAYTRALTEWQLTGPPGPEERVAAATQRKNAILQGLVQPAPLPSNPASPQTVANPASSFSDEQLVSAVFKEKGGSSSVQGSETAYAGTTPIPGASTNTGSSGSSSRTSYSGSASAAASAASAATPQVSLRSSEPIRVIVEEARGSMIMKLVRFMLGIIIYGFITLSVISLLLENSGMMKAATSRQPGSLEVQPASSTKKVTFADVHGADEAKQELQEVVDFLRNPQKYAKLGGRLAKGVLLTGPPGTGKTLLARATAGEAGVSFLFASGSEFDELFVGVGAKRVRELFAAARKAAPCIIFIDELDAIGSKRSPRDAQHMRQTLNQLLTELDGFNQSEGVILLGATNLPQLLDKALTRPGRFDRHVAVPLPDVRGRMKILEHHIKVTRPSPAVDLSQLARGTPGFSGAQLENLVNQAAVKASGDGSALVEPRHFEWAKDRILMGAERLSAFITPESRRKTAFHEAGHALLAMYTDGAMPLHAVTVVPRGHSLGHTMQLPEMDRDSESYKELRARLDVAMGGRVAEELIYGKENITSGAESDIRGATSIANAMCRNYGFSDALGVVNLSEDEKLSSSTLALIEGEVKSLIDEAQQRARTLLSDRAEELNRLAEALITYESLNQSEVRLVLAGEALNRPVV